MIATLRATTIAIVFAVSHAALAQEPPPPAVEPPAPRGPHLEYVIEKRVSWGLLGSGIGVFSAGWIPMIIVEGVFGGGLFIIPVFGPFIVAGGIGAASAANSSSSGCSGNDACAAGGV